MFWCFFGFKGRLSREPYVLGLLVMMLVIKALPPIMEIHEGHILFFDHALPVLLVSIVVQFALVIKRLHDFGRSGLLSIVLVFPMVNLVFALFLALFPGNQGRNRFGDRTNVPPG